MLKASCWCVWSLLQSRVREFTFANLDLSWLMTQMHIVLWHTLTVCLSRSSNSKQSYFFFLARLLQWSKTGNYLLNSKLYKNPCWSKLRVNLWNKRLLSVLTFRSNSDLCRGLWLHYNREQRGIPRVVNVKRRQRWDVVSWASIKSNRLCRAR